MKPMPEVIGTTFWSSSVIAGVPSSVHVVFDVFVRLIAPSRDPAAPCMVAAAPSWPDVHAAGTAVVGDGPVDGEGEGRGAMGTEVLRPLTARTPAKTPAANTTAVAPTATAFSTIRR
jgi:hypothetical protein